MAICLMQMFWNLVAGVFVLGGHYHAPTEADADALGNEEDDRDDERPAPNPSPSILAEPSVGA